MNGYQEFNLEAIASDIEQWELLFQDYIKATEETKTQAKEKWNAFDRIVANKQFMSYPSISIPNEILLLKYKRKLSDSHIRRIKSFWKRKYSTSEILQLMKSRKIGALPVSKSQEEIALDKYTDEEYSNSLIYEDKEFLELIYTKVCQVKSRPETNSSKTKIRRGISEMFFEKALSKNFGNLVLTNRQINSNDRVHYYPDFLIFDPDSAIGIDIEVDEPYDLEKKSPIHTNDYHESQNWREPAIHSENYCIIRFSEEQIIRFPNDCVKLIGDIYDFIRDINNRNMLKFEHSHPTWSLMQAIDMAEKNYREQYLKELRIN